ncbi:MAG: homoserine dehydrogenase [Lautropia sp. SCN 66-9]|nr:MAG: homoserine dehydrogenase [Lautropia sp. SCN 66-9]
MSTEKFGPVRVGLLGIGTVGGGTFEVLKRNRDEIRRRAGRSIEIVKVADLNVERARAMVGSGVEVVADARDVVKDPNIDVVIELIGGYGIARELVLEAIEHGKHVVTANKALLAVHGNEIFRAASRRHVMVAFEAAVAGGIPIIKALREGLTANRIEWIAGIINGTTNFILSEMRDKGLAFDVVLKEAQRLGYAEADPTFDIEGVDAAHKATILSAIAFGVPVQFERAHVEGITALQSEDIRYAEQLGYRIKLLGITRRRDGADGKPAGIELRVHPTLIPAKRLIASVEGAMNAVWVKGEVDVARMFTADPENRVPHLAFQAESLSDLPILPIEEVETAYSLRLRVADEPGVLADITRILADARISIDAVLQREPAEGENQTDIILLTHRTIERQVNTAIARIETLPTVLSKAIRIRLEDLV